MKVGILNRQIRGGAANAALRLHNGLRSAGVHSEFFNLVASDAQQGLTFPPELMRTVAQRVANKYIRPALVNRVGWPSWALSEKLCVEGCDVFSHVSYRPMRCLGASLEDCDVIHLHWVAGMVDLPVFLKRFGGRKPLVWTLHDMRAFTGGCHYSNRCTKYRAQCGNCPQLKKAAPNDFSARNFRESDIALGKLRNQDLRIVTPSRWLAAEVQSSKLLSRFSTTVIPYGVSQTFLENRERNACRASLGLGNGRIAMLFVSDNLTNHRKGFDLLIAALKICENEVANLDLITVGAFPLEGELPKTCNVRHLGRIDEENRLAEIYTASDLFVIPSREDNLPNTVLESLACGTPVIGFATGGLTDLILPGQTGWLASEISAEDLSQTIRKAISDCEHVRQRNSCRDFAIQRFTLERQASEYTKLYRDVVDGFVTNACE